MNKQATDWEKTFTNYISNSNYNMLKTKTKTKSFPKLSSKRKISDQNMGKQHGDISPKRIYRWQINI